MRIASAQQMRQLDQTAIRERGIPSDQLMERAAAALAETAMDLAGTAGSGPFRAVCFCGGGNNGGDGVACARLLLEAGYEVRCILVGSREKLTADTRTMEARLAAAGGRLECFAPDDAEFAAWCMEARVMVDALFGIGLNTPLRGDALTAVHMMNTSAIPVVSADLPSGVEADTGRVLGAAVQAAATVTFTLPKAGHFVGKGGVCTGKLVVADIGIPRELVDALECPIRTVEAADVILSRRARDAHKGDFGRVYILAGSVGYTGAPVLAAQAAVRSGAGLVTVGVPAPVWPVAAAKLDEAMPHPLPAGKEGQLSLDAGEAAFARLSACGVCLIGPGLGRGNSVSAVVRHLLPEIRIPVVLDADGINALEGHIDVLDGRKGLHTVLTPHDGEFARLGGDLSGGDRLGAARAFAMEHGCCLVLKGHCTITAFPDGSAYLNTTGNPGMAKGGSGDVLAGLILSLLGQGLPARQAVPMAVWLHGAAGDLCAGEIGEYGMTPSDLIAALPRVIQQHVK